MLDWDDLRFFLAVARHRTLAAAAKHLQVTQSTVSRRIASLQDGMGVRLLNRTAEGYVPTLAGESICACVERIEAEALSVERAVAGHDVRLEGTVRVSASQFLTSHFLASSFAALQFLLKRILIEALPEMPGSPLAGREADIVLRLRPFDDQDLFTRKVGEVAFGLYGSLDYFVQHGEPDLAAGCPGHQLITLLNDQEMPAQAAWLSENASRARVALRADSYETQQCVAFSGGGLALLPRFRADAEPSLRRVEPNAPAPPAAIWLGVHPETRQAPRVRIVLDLIAEAFRTSPPTVTPPIGEIAARNR